MQIPRGRFRLKETFNESVNVISIVYKPNAVQNLTGDAKEITANQHRLAPLLLKKKSESKTAAKTASRNLSFLEQKGCNHSHSSSSSQ